MESRPPPPPDGPRTGEPDPEAPAPPPAPGPEAAPGSEAAPIYQGPVPPGGWQQPISRPGPSAGAPLAGWGSRVGAALFDILVLTVPVVALIVLVVVVAAGSEVGAVVVAIVAFLSYVVVALFYAPVLMSRDGHRNGQTWGKQIAGIRVTRDNGQPVELGFGFLREFLVKNLLFGTVGGFFLYIPTLLDWLWPLWDDQNRCLHDMVVSTHVVRA
jgi:uncharacterized RDD family membrane protein YckC